MAVFIRLEGYFLSKILFFKKKSLNTMHPYT
jgi:hypothetical protein